MTEDAELGARLEAAVRTGGGSELTSVGEAIDRYVFDGAVFPSSLFEQVLSVIRGAEFRRLSESVGIIKLFEYNLGLLTDTQKQQLFTTLSESIPELADSISAFLAVELIAEIWRDNRSLEALLHLIREASENTLTLAVHGLDWLAKKADQTDTRTRCLDELQRLSKHPSPLVRAEAINALKRRMA
jgi:hypothetical protein